MLTWTIIPDLLEPEAAGRFFDGHSASVSASERDCWISTFGNVSGETGRDLHVRMDKTGRDAFLALVEACVERAGIPTFLNDNLSSIADLKTYSRSLSSAATQNKAFFTISEPIFYNGVHIVSPDPNHARVDVAGMFDRGCERDLWESLVRATFQMFFCTSSVYHYVTTSGGASTTWTDTLQLFPFAFEKFRIADVTSGTKGTGVRAYMLDGYEPYELHNGTTVGDANVYGAEATADAVWASSSEMTTPATPWCVNGDGRIIDGPKTVRGMVHTVQYQICGIEDIVEFASSDGREDLLDALRLNNDGRLLFECYRENLLRNTWTRPATWTSSSVATLAAGPQGITRRRSQLAYGVVQQMLACMRVTNAVFQLHTMFEHATTTTTTTHAISWDADGDSLEVDGVGSDTTETETEDKNGVFMSRARTLGDGPSTVKGRIRVKKVVDANNVWLMSEADIVNACPGFLTGDTYYSDMIATPGNFMSFVPGYDQGESDSIEQTRSRTTADMSGFSCYAQKSWPLDIGSTASSHTGDYISTACMTAFERFEDGLHEFDLYGVATRIPQWLDDATASEASTKTGIGVRGATWWAETGDDCWDWASAAHAMASTWNTWDVQPTMPDRATLNITSVATAIDAAVRTGLRDMQFYAWFRSDGPSVVINGVRYYPPTGYSTKDSAGNEPGDAAWNSATATTTLTQSQTRTCAGVEYYVADQPGFEVDWDQAGDIWNGAVGISETFRMGHSDAIGSVEWAFKAAPNTPSETV